MKYNKSSLRPLQNQLHGGGGQVQQGQRLIHHVSGHRGCIVWHIFK